MIGFSTVLVGVFTLLLLSSACAQVFSSNGSLQESDLDGMLVPVLLCGPKIVPFNKTSYFEQKVLNTGADPAKRVVYYSTYSSFEPRFRMGPLYAADAVSYAVACSSNVPDGTVGDIIWQTNVTNLPDGHQDALGRGLELLPNATMLISFERANYNGTLTSGIFLSNHLAVLDARTGAQIFRRPIDPANPDKLYQVEANIMTTASNLPVFKATEWIPSRATPADRRNLIWPGLVQISASDPSVDPYNLLNIQYSDPSSEGNIVYDTVVAEFGQFETIIPPVSAGVPGALTIVAIDTLTGQLTPKINLSYANPSSRSLSVDRLSGDVYVTGRRRFNTVVLTKLDSKAESILWTQNYTAQFLDSNGTAQLYVCGSTYIAASQRVVMAFEIVYPARYPSSTPGAVVDDVSIMSIRNPRVSVMREFSSGTNETFVANPVPETANQQSHGVNTVDILLLVVDGKSGQLISARIVGTPFADVCQNVEYAGDGVLALFGNFPTVYVNPLSSGRQSSVYPVLFDVTDAGADVGGMPNANQTDYKSPPDSKNETSEDYEGNDEDANC
jgi:hypothetical protein